MSEQAPTAGAFLVLTSNCFMDALADAWATHAAPNVSYEVAYEATRREMDGRIFDEGLPCDAEGRPSPFAAPKMRDRMRGSIYPFLPLSDDQAVAAFELQLQACSGPPAPRFRVAASLRPDP